MRGKGQYGLKVLNSAPDKIRIKLDFYDVDHKKALSQLPYPETVQQLAGTTIEVSSADIFAYYLFHKQRQRPDLYSSLNKVRDLFPNEVGDLCGRRSENGRIRAV